MPRNILLLGLLCLSIVLCGQQRKQSFSQGKYSHEIKYNYAYSILNISEISYEFNQHWYNSSIGVSVMFSNYNNDDLDFIFTPYFRKYIGTKPSHGFFVEAHTLLIRGVDNNENIKASALGIGASAGGKFIRNDRWHPILACNLGYRF